MTIYKVIECYVEDEKVYYVFPYHVSFKQLKIFGGSRRIRSWLSYVFINSSLTESKACKKRDRRLKHELS